LKSAEYKLEKMTKKILQILNGKIIFPPPLWMMRQAGRTLPEYRQLRQKAGHFLNLCYDPDLACEATLQPIRRFDFDAAIIFSDILVVPHALGRKLDYKSGEGPIMEPLDPQDIEKLQYDEVFEKLEPIFQALRLVRKNLADDKALIGFCGAPWTVATYMIAGHATPDQAPARLLFYQQPKLMQKLLDILADISANYLIKQIEAGADLVQIFDSWSGVLDEVGFEACAIWPVKKMVKHIRSRFPDVPIIGFPRGAGLFYRDYAQKTGVTAVSLDWTIPLDFAAEVQNQSPIQGNLDPQRLVAGGDALEQGVEAILTKLALKPLIFNLGHGVEATTPLDHIEKMITQVRYFNK